MRADVSRKLLASRPGSVLVLPIIALLAVLSSAKTAQAFALDPAAAGSTVEGVLQTAARWPADMELGITIQVGVEVGFAADLGATGPEVALVNQAVLDAFGAWESAELRFEVSLEAAGVAEGPASGFEIDVFAVPGTHPFFAGTDFFGVTDRSNSCCLERPLTNGQSFPGSSIQGADVFVNFDNVLGLAAAFLFTQQEKLDALQRLIMHELGHALGLGHPNSNNPLWAPGQALLFFDTDLDPLNVMNIDPMDPFGDIQFRMIFDGNADDAAIMSNRPCGEPFVTPCPALFFTSLRNDDLGGRDVLYPPDPRMRIVVPNSMETVEGNVENRFPLGATAPQRVQQVYHASDFASISGPHMITEMSFRPDALVGTAFTRTLDLQINLSTTSLDPDFVSPTFAANIGPDEAVVLDASTTISSAFTGPAEGPKDFDIVIPLQTPFLYIPAYGNLLVDVRNSTGLPAVFLNAYQEAFDSVSRVWTPEGSMGDPTGNRDTLGLVTRFTLLPGDGDGVADAIEDAGPMAGDGNADGTLDSEQPAVASLPDAGGVDYVTLEVLGGCNTLLDVDVMSEAQVPWPDMFYDYPFGLVEFRVPCASAVVKIWFHGATSLSPPYRKYGPTEPGNPTTDAWYTLPSAVFGTDVADGGTVATVTLTLSDGVLGDDTGVDGEIVDMGGPAASVFAVPALSPLARGLLIVGIGVLSLVALRRRQGRDRATSRGAVDAQARCVHFRVHSGNERPRSGAI